MSNLKRTELRDPEGDTLAVERLAPGLPARLPVTLEEWVYLRTSEDGAYINVGELLSGIEEATGVKLEASVEPKAEPLWTEVRERPARAVKVTPELVRTLAGDDVPPELAGLEPQFDRATGEPVGVIVFDHFGLATIGRYVVLSGAHGTSVLKPEEFERLFEVAT